MTIELPPGIAPDRFWSAPQGTDRERREAWLAHRTSAIGSSEAAGILGLSKYATRLSVYLDKTGQGERGRFEGEWLAWGTRLQAAIASGFSEDVERGIELADPYSVVHHATVPYAAASLDAWQPVHPRDPARGPGSLEIKNLASFKRHEWDDGVPQHYIAQLQWQLWVTGWGWGTVAGLVGGNELIYQDIDRDEETIAALSAAAEKFWREHVLARVAPEPTGSEVDTAALKALYKSETGKMVTLPRDLVMLDDELRGIGEQSAALKARHEEIRNKIRAFIGEATYGDLGDGHVYRRKWIEKDPQPATAYWDLRKIRKPAHLW